MGLFAYRLLGAAIMDGGMYEGIEADRRTTMQALAAVMLASLAAGVGAGEWLGTRVETLVAVTALAIVFKPHFTSDAERCPARLQPGRSPSQTRCRPIGMTRFRTH